MTVSKTEVVVPVLVATAASFLIAKFRPFGKELVWLKRGVTVGGLTLSTFFIARAFRKKPKKPPVLPKQPEKENLPNPFEAKLIHPQSRKVANGLREKRVDPQVLRGIAGALFAILVKGKILPFKRQVDVDRLVDPFWSIPDDLFGTDESGRAYRKVICDLREIKFSEPSSNECVTRLAAKAFEELSLAFWPVCSEKEQEVLTQWAANGEDFELSLFFPPPLSGRAKELVAAVKPYKKYGEELGSTGHGDSAQKRAVKTPAPRRKMRKLDGLEISRVFREIVERMQINGSKALDMSTPVKKEALGPAASLRKQVVGTPPRNYSSSPSTVNLRTKVTRKWANYSGLLKEAVRIVEGIAEAARGPYALSSLRGIYTKILEAIPKEEKSVRMPEQYPSPAKERGIVKEVKRASRNGKLPWSAVCEVRIPHTAGLSLGASALGALAPLSDRLKGFSASTDGLSDAMIVQQRLALGELETLCRLGLEIVEQLQKRTTVRHKTLN